MVFILADLPPPIYFAARLKNKEAVTENVTCVVPVVRQVCLLLTCVEQALYFTAEIHMLGISGCSSFLVLILVSVVLKEVELVRFMVYILSREMRGNAKITPEVATYGFYCTNILIKHDAFRKNKHCDCIS